MNLLAQANIVVIKIGASFIMDSKKSMVNHVWVDSLVDDVIELIRLGKRPVIVSSGTVAFGAYNLGLNCLKLKIQEKQIASIVGQHEMIEVYKNSFKRHNIKIAQGLVTVEDIEVRKRFLTMKTTLEFLLNNSVVPIINTNDLLTSSEIRFGDNDRLSARIAQVVNADLLVMFSLVDGLYAKDPLLYPNSNFINEVRGITQDIENMAQDSRARTGGMSAKITAAKIALNNKCNVIFTNGRYNNPIKRIV
ncbi:MAG: glutamate 5-kinase, partial [Pseudomonadota bacterium]